MTNPTRVPRFPHAISPHTIDQLLAFHRATFGGWRMDAATPPPAGGGTETPPAGAGPAPSSSGEPPAGGTPTPPPPTEKTFTQADLDAIIKKRLDAEKVKFDQQLKDLQDTAGKSELEKAQIEKQQADERATQVTKESAARVAKTEAKLAAFLGGAREDRLDAVLKQADLTAAVSDDGTVDEAAVKTAIEKVLTDYPEWKKTTGDTPPASGGEMGGGGQPGQKPVFTREQIKNMSQEERVRRLDELNEAMADGRIRG